MIVGNELYAQKTFYKTEDVHASFVHESVEPSASVPHTTCISMNADNELNENTKDFR